MFIENYACQIIHGFGKYRLRKYHKVDQSVE